MKLLSLPLALIGVLGLSSCGLLRTATQLPARTLQTVGRTIGLGLEETEVQGENAARSKVNFEVKEGEQSPPPAR